MSNTPISWRAMVFHMLRKILGEEVFWGALKDVYRNHLFQEISWEDFQKAFELRGRRSLAQFFPRWISWKVAPELSLNQVYAKPSGKAFRVGGELAQSPPFSEDHVAALFFPLAPRTAKTVAAKITHYGKYGYLVFRG